MIVHVVPLNDILPHDESGTACPCVPRVEYCAGYRLVIHNAWDHREALEKQAMRATGGRA